MTYLRFCLVVLLAFGALSVYAQTESVYYARAFPDLPPIESPLGLDFANDGSDRLYTAELGGRIRVFENRPDVDTAYVFLDITDRVQPDPDRPGQMYSLAFHPDYAANGYVFVYYVTTGPDRSVLARYTRSADDPLRADPASEVVLLDVPQPDLYNHNGGRLAFGPEGYLYLSLGDGGIFLDAPGNAQNRENLLGSVIRIDVDHTDGERPYAIPFDNPYVGNTQGWREEIWAHGFRNPWRFSFDRVTGDLWLGDVGESTWEEVNLVEGGRNYGWNIMEGPECLNGGPCATEGLTPPFYVYPRDVGVSVTGGFVYRGWAIPSLYGKYVFGDFNGGRVWVLDIAAEEPQAVELFAPFPVASFGEDREGELYMPNLFHGQFFKIVSTTQGGGETVDVADASEAPEVAVSLTAVPNPFRERTEVAVVRDDGGAARVSLHDLLGRELAVLFDGELAPGRTERITVAGAGLPAGVYLVRVVSEGAVETRRVTLLR